MQATSGDSTLTQPTAVLSGAASELKARLPYSCPVKAAVYTRYSPPEVVRIAKVDKPEAGENELRVKFEATTVNRTDCGYRAATPFILSAQLNGISDGTSNLDREGLLCS